MDRWDWLLVVGSIVLGQFALLVIELLRSWLERRRVELDRRNSFQERTLLELQEAVDTITLNGTAIVAKRTNSHFSLWKFTDIPYTDPEARAVFSSHVRMLTLAERVNDENVRSKVEALDAAIKSTAMADSKDEMRSEWDSTRDIRKALNDRIGEVLRAL